MQAAAVTPGARNSTLSDFSASLQQLSRDVRRAVVQIFTTGYAPVDDADLNGSAILMRQRSTGSGAIVSQDGYLLTNAHVVEGARRVMVRLPATREQLQARRSILQPEGKSLPAKVVGVDHETDLAILKVEATGLPYLQIGNSDDLRQGELVLAFGNPLGLEGSVSMGVVSSTARQVRPDDPMIYIQTDAPINPGNSGGPLVDTDGRLMGVNTFILSQSGGSEGIGFAVPANIARNVFQQIRSGGHVHRGQIGVDAQTITPELAAGLALPQDWGVLVADVFPEGPADKAGIKVGDLVLSLNGKPMENARQLEVNIYRHPVKDTIQLELLRGGERMSVSVPVIERVDDPERFVDLANPQDNMVPKLGILGIGITKDLSTLLPNLRNAFGVVVAARSAAAPYAGTGLRPGDVIYSVNTVPVTSVEALKKKLDEFQPGQTTVLQIERSGHLLYLPLELD